jgi:hypothetical protein
VNRYTIPARTHPSCAEERFDSVPRTREARHASPATVASTMRSSSVTVALVRVLPQVPPKRPVDAPR